MIQHTVTGTWKVDIGLYAVEPPVLSLCQVSTDDVSA